MKGRAAERLDVLVKIISEVLEFYSDLPTVSPTLKPLSFNETVAVTLNNDRDSQAPLTVWVVVQFTMKHFWSRKG